MDFTALTQIIGTMGFPITACILMGWYVKYQTDKNREDITRITEEHKEDMKHVTEALNNNTIAITRLCEKIGGDN